jgi:hypothetical protein
MVAYRVAADLDARRRGRRPFGSLADVARRLLRAAARAQRRGDLERTVRVWDDYLLAVQAGIARRQTRELYEESATGAVVREALDLLRERNLIAISRRAPRGPYGGFEVSERGMTEASIEPWYRRLLGFFDPPVTPESRQSPR